MKRLILSAIVGLSLASAANTTIKKLNLDIGVGLGYIDSKYKDIIFKFEKNIYPYFNIGGKFAKDYVKGYISTIPVAINLNNKHRNTILMDGKVGIEQFKIKDKFKKQAFIEYRIVLPTETRINPKGYLQIGNKSISAGIGAFLIYNKNLSLEYEIGKRWLYNSIENKKNTTSTAIYINYSF